MKKTATPSTLLALDLRGAGHLLQTTPREAGVPSEAGLAFLRRLAQTQA